MGAVLLLAAALVLWDIAGNGWANAYYSVAVRTASRSWSAFFTVSLDLSRTVSVDKTPLSIWMMALSARLFGFGPAALLVPNALCAVASVAVLYHTTRRVFGSSIALLAALLLAVTPVSVAVGRFNNPDSLLVLLLVVAAWAATRALESGRARDAAICGAVVGLAFNTKMLQAYLVLPAFAAALMLAGRGDGWARIRSLLAGVTATVSVSFGWIGAMSLIPPTARPWVGDTTANSWLQLAFGANGIGRIDTGLLHGRPSSAGTGPLRLLGGVTGGQVAWFFPLAVAGTIISLLWLRRGERSRPARGALVLWITWAAVHGLVFSLVLGLFHPYYVSALAPAVSVLAAIGADQLWRRRRASRAWSLAGVLTSLCSAGLAVVLLTRTPGFVPWLKWAIPIGTVLAAIAAIAALELSGLRSARRALAAGALLALTTAGPLSYSWATTLRRIGGIDPLAGPGAYEEPGWASDDSASRMELIRLLKSRQGNARYLAALSGSLAGAPIALLSRREVVIMGGFAGSDPAPSVMALRRLIRERQVRSVVLSSSPLPRTSTLSSGLGGQYARDNWVRQHCSAVGIPTSLPSPSGPLLASVFSCAGGPVG